MNGIMLILFILVLIQTGLIVRKMGRIQHSEELVRVNELMDYVDNKSYDLYDERGMNALMIASASHVELSNGEVGYQSVVKRAIEKGFDINKASLSVGKTPLMYAVRNSDTKGVATMLLEAGADVNIKDMSGRTVLFDAVKAVTDDHYTTIVDKVDNINHQDAYGINVLMIAAYEMNLNRILDLLNRGADVKLKNKAGQNAYDVARDNLDRHIQRAIESENLDEGVYQEI